MNLLSTDVVISTTQETEEKKIENDKKSQTLRLSVKHLTSLVHGYLYIFFIYMPSPSTYQLEVLLDILMASVHKI